MDFEPSRKRLAPPVRGWLTGLVNLALLCLAPHGSSLAAEPSSALPPANAKSLSRMDPALARRLDEAYAIARQSVERVASCRTLFRHLERPGAQSLTETFYVQASGAQERRICRRGVTAFTEVGGRVTYLCRGFRRLPAPRAAIALVHEALHRAGLEESPRWPEAPSSAEINDRVARACGL